VYPCLCLCHVIGAYVVRITIEYELFSNEIFGLKFGFNNFELVQSSNILLALSQII
jgi:hypothetical protein